MVTFIKLYINKTKLKKDNSDINLNDINEQFYVSNYESYNRLKIELKHNLIESLVAIIILSTILGLIYFNVNKNQKDFEKNRKSLLTNSARHDIIGTEVKGKRFLKRRKATVKKLPKNFKKPLDKPSEKCYNESTRKPNAP